MCDCTAQVEESIQERWPGLKINEAVSLAGGPSKVIVETYWESGSKKRRPNIIATHCPFCGKSYKQEPS